MAKERKLSKSGNTREERLHALKAMGILSDEEYAKKRKAK